MSTAVLNDNNFDAEVIGSGRTCLVDFFATWCGPCRIMSPVIDEIAAENPDVFVGKVDVDEADEIAARYGIMSIPTLMIFKNGESVKTFVGVTDKQAIVEALK